MNKKAATPFLFSALDMNGCGFHCLYWMRAVIYVVQLLFGSFFFSYKFIVIKKIFQMEFQLYWKAYQKLRTSTGDRMELPHHVCVFITEVIFRMNWYFCGYMHFNVRVNWIYQLDERNILSLYMSVACLLSADYYVVFEKRTRQIKVYQKFHLPHIRII